MAGYGWCYYESTSWGNKAQDQIPQTEVNRGTKRSILVDGKGVPICVSVDGANRHDMKMSKATLQSIVVYRPEPTFRSKQHICLDKGYDFPEVYELLEEYGYTIHIPLRGEEHKDYEKSLSVSCLIRACNSALATSASLLITGRVGILYMK